MNKAEQNKQLLLTQFKKTPIVQVACEKLGIGRASYYRWRNDDEDFAEAADEALAEGAQLVNDMAESQLLSAIKNQNMTAIIFWLKHHHNRYATKVEVTAKHQQIDEQLTPEQQAIVTEALRLAGLPQLETNSKEDSDEPDKPTK